MLRISRECHMNSIGEFADKLVSRLHPARFGVQNWLDDSTPPPRLDHSKGGEGGKWFSLRLPEDRANAPPKVVRVRPKTRALCAKG